MPDLGDYHAFISTSSGGSGSRSSGSSSGDSGDPGCAGCVTWFMAIVSLLWIIGKIIGQEVTINTSVCSGNHIPCSYLCILGCGGYKNTEQIICMTATGDNNFLSDGIVEGTLLFIDTSSKFKSGLLNVFKYNSGFVNKDREKSK